MVQFAFKGHPNNNVVWFAWYEKERNIGRFFHILIINSFDVNSFRQHTLWKSFSKYYQSSHLNENDNNRTEKPNGMIVSICHENGCIFFIEPNV